MSRARVVDTGRRPRPVLGRLMVALLISGALVPLGMDAAAADVPSLSIDDVTVQEPSASGANSLDPNSVAPDSVPAVFTVTLDQPAPAPVSVHFATAMSFPPNEFPHDIRSTSGWLTIDPGAQTAQITVLVNHDSRYEPTEYFTVELDQPSGVAIADGSGLGTILNSNRNGSFWCNAAGFTYQGRSADNYDAYGAANTDFRGKPQHCSLDHAYEAGWFDNGTANAYVPAVPDYLHWGAFALEGYTRTDPVNYMRSIPSVGDAGMSTGAAADGSVTTSSGFTLKFDSARADAVVRCAAVGANPPAPVLIGTSHLRGLTLGKYAHVYTSDYAKRPFGIDGQIELNKQTVTPIADGMRLTQQAIVITYGSGATWVVGEAIVEYRGNPCRH